MSLFKFVTTCLFLIASFVFLFSNTPEASDDGGVKMEMTIKDKSINVKEYVEYLDNLKVCSPHTHSYKHPFVADFIAKNIIKGKKGDKCHAVYIMPGGMELDCQHTMATLAVLTSPKEFENAKKGILSGSSDSAASEAMNRECVLMENGKVLELDP